MSAQKNCLWDAFGVFTCDRKAAPQNGNIFARAQPRADWEMFTAEQEQEQHPPSNPGLSGYDASSRGAPLTSDKSGNKREGFCGCQGAAVPS